MQYISNVSDVMNYLKNRSTILTCAFDSRKVGIMYAVYASF